MNIKTQLTLASVIAAGLLASGCSQQMVAQQAAAEPAPAVKTIVDCSNCDAPAPVAPAPQANKWAHNHPAIPNCTDSVSHTHKYNNRNHNHAYSCKKAAPAPRVAPRPAPAPAPRRPAASGHVHPAVPGCTHTVRHNHPGANPGHKHRYSCQQPMAQRPVIQQPRPVVQVPVMPKVKAKGTYRGPIQIDGVMQQYQQ